MRPFLLSLLALSACARPISAPVAVARSDAPRSEVFSLPRFELGEANPRVKLTGCSIGPSELDCQTKLLASATRAGARPSDGAATSDVLTITRQDGAVLYAQALRTGVSQARLRSSLPVTARK